MQMLGLGRRVGKFSKSSPWRGTRVIFGHEVIGVLGHEEGATIYAAREAGSSRVCALKHVVVRGERDLRVVERMAAEHEAGVGVSHDGLRATTGLYVRRMGGRVVQAVLVMQV
jgi:hypothetical protein